MFDEEEYTLIGRQGITRKRIKRKGILRILYKICFILIIIFSTYFITKNYLIEVEENNEDVINISQSQDIPKDSKLYQIENFFPVNGNNTKGPITINRLKDNGKKTNMYDKILNITENNLDSFYYDYATFNILDQELRMKDEYFCETEGYRKEYEIKCPNYYHIAIDKAFYGRYARDLSHCTENDNGEEIPLSNLIHIKNMVTNCGKEYTSYFKETCNGYENCRIVPSLSFFRNSCRELFKYMYIKYRCVKDKEIKKPNFAITMFANNVKPNSIYENSISEFYQYANINNYSFFLNNKRYDNDRSLYYMKINTIIETMIYGLKTKEFDWVFWVDCDTALSNPNIKLEVFVPTDSDIHLIFAEDKNGLNAGIFLLRVHSWTLNFLMRAKSYQYFNKEEDLYFVDQAAINNALVAGHEERHYIIVPEDWFNTWFDDIKPNSFVYHFSGRDINKNKESARFRELMNSNPNWCASLTNKKLRKDVLDYYEKNKDVNKRKKLSVQH
ncbi:glycosyltransferase family 34 protein [Piromyces sp. E2]|nr:glycosyltransferase family 34 protein [Piromyces sp. E2]|eukprot:OUM60469.1 glycosyltransferase family 34 protein [Piromyces sp. E2]